MPGILTVGICAYNEEQNIGSLLSNIISIQNLPPESEILVICSGCTDQTVNIAREFQRVDSRIKLIVEKERKGKATAINQIMSKAKNDIILFISADTLPIKDCFKRLIVKFDDPATGIVCGKPVPTNKKTSLGKIVKLLWSFHDLVFKELEKIGQLRHASEIYCIRKRIVNEI